MACIEKRQGKTATTFRAIVKRDGRVLKQSFDSRLEAERWARDVEVQLDRGAFVNREAGPRLEDLFERYEQEVMPSHRGATSEKYRIATLKKSALATIKATDLLARHVAEFRDLRLKSVKPASVNRELATLSGCLNVARKDWGYLFVNPIPDIRKPKEPAGRSRRVSVAEEQLLLSIAAPVTRKPNGTFPKGTRVDWLGPIVILAVESAMRRGEILGLDWKHVDFSQSTAHLPITKNGSSRDVPLSRRALSELQALHKIAKKPTSGPVFSSVNQNAFRLAWQRLVKRAREDYLKNCAASGSEPNQKMFEDLHFHDLRHEATSRLAEKLEAHELAKVTGHKDLRMMMRYYHPDAAVLARKIR
jgi:integrase